MNIQKATRSDEAARVRSDRIWSVKSSAFLINRPITAVLLIFGLDLILKLVLIQAARVMFPGISADFASLVVISLLTVVMVSVLGWWRVSGYNKPAQWRSLALVILPYLTVGVLPLILGINQVTLSTSLYFLLAYVLVALHEETIFRGVILHTLTRKGPRQAILFSSILFGLSHITNLLVRSNPFLTLAQMVGAFSSGVGLAAVRMRTNTIWFVLGLHFLEDFLLHYTRLPAIPLNVAQSVILLLYGLYLMRDRQALEAPLGSIAADPQNG